MTAVGAVRLSRWHTRCPGCGEVGFAADGVLGLGGHLTTRAWRMATLAGVHDPFRQAARVLGELAGWSVAAETLRRGTHAAAARATRGRAARTALPGAFAAAAGDREVQVDAGKVNTPDGWRDVKLAVLAARERGPASSAADPEQRDLPAPAARSVVAAVEEAQAFGRRCRAEADRLGVTDRAAPGVADPAAVTVLGDGADWVWRLAGEQFADAAQVLDVYHATEYLAAAGRATLPAGELAPWLDGARRLLVGDGYAGAAQALAGLPTAAADVGAALNYLAGHRDRLGYAARLRRGQAIGSGLVEGTIKQRVNLRLKRTGARWLAAGVGPFVELLALADTPEWAEHWTTVAA